VLNLVKFNETRGSYESWQLVKINKEFFDKIAANENMHRFRETLTGEEIGTYIPELGILRHSTNWPKIYAQNAFFTINSLVYKCNPTGEYVVQDMNGGKGFRDLANFELVTNGDPNVRINEDPLFILLCIKWQIKSEYNHRKFVLSENIITALKEALPPIYWNAKQDYYYSRFMAFARKLYQDSSPQDKNMIIKLLHDYKLLQWFGINPKQKLNDELVKQFEEKLNLVNRVMDQPKISTNNMFTKPQLDNQPRQEAVDSQVAAQSTWASIAGFSNV
jgi:hypothetical protein